LPPPAMRVACAVAMQQGIARHNRRSAEPLSMRVGIAVGEATCEESDYFGTPVVEASRLCAAAEGGQVLVTEMVRVLAGNRVESEFESLGAVELKGLPVPVPVCRVAWQGVVEAGLPLPPRLQVDTGLSFVGRASEQEVLASAWKEAQNGNRHVVFIGGEPGMGKTRLASELALAVHGEGATVLVGTCDEGLAMPYKSFVEALRHYVAVCPEDELAEDVGARGAELVRLLPELRRRFPELPPPQTADAETERYLLFEAVTGVVAAASQRRPVMLLLDDLHWATKPTLLLLKHVVRFPSPMALLIVGTYRDTDLSRGHPLTELLADLRRESGVQRLVLRGLSDVEAVAFMEAMAGHQFNNLELAHAIYAETDGSPFFMREILLHLAETGAVFQTDGRWTYRGDVTAIGIPESVREVIGRRLARLPESTDRLLTVGAVIGRDFDIAVLVAVTGFGDSSVIELLEEAESAGLVREVPERPGRFTFSHALIRDTLYRQLGATKRMALHRAVATAMEGVVSGRTEDYLPELAHQWLAAIPTIGVLAADASKAADYTERAGRQAMSSLAYEEAVQHFEGALRAIGLVDDAARRCELLIALGEAQRCAGDPTHRETLLEAGRLARRLGDHDRCARAALANHRGVFSRFGAVDLERATALEDALETFPSVDSSIRARLLAALASELHFTGDARRHELGSEAVLMARRLGDPATLAQVLAASWFATWDPATPGERAVVAEELTKLAQELGDGLLEFHAGIALFLTATQQADMERAETGLAACAGAAERLGQAALRWRALYLQVNRALAAGRLQVVEELAARSEEVGRAAAQPDAALFSQPSLGIVRMLQGRPAEARDVFAALGVEFPNLPAVRAALGWAAADSGRIDEARIIFDALRAEGFADIARDYVWVSTLSLLSRLCVLLEDSQTAPHLYELLLPHRSEIVTTQAMWLGPAAHDLGLLAMTIGRYDEAAESFGSAAEVEERIGARAMLVHTRIEWARMLLRRGAAGDADRARALLEAANDGARELGLTGMAPRIQALILKASS
jgi:tetratricopeptide (TPR) repeat protein